MADIMSSVTRREIPQLVLRRSRVGKADTLRRSFPTGHGEYFRIYRNEPLRLEVEFLKDLPNLTVVLHTNLGNHDGTWQEVKFQKIGPRKYGVDVHAEKCGSFRFKLKYTLDNGQNWYWDRLPFSEVLVDSANTRHVAMYTLIPTVSGPISTWKEQLQRVRAMNFNAVHLLPVTQMGPSESPYAADDLFSVDRSYLDPADPRSGLDQFEDFVECARSLDIRLCMDLVLNHIGVSSTLAESCPGWIVSDPSEPDGLRRAGCWHKNQWIKWQDLVKIDYDNPQRKVKADIWQYMTKYANFWSSYAAYTGGMIRFDNMHSSHEEFMTHCTRAIRREFPDIVILAEFFSNLPTLQRKVSEWGLNLLLANPWECRLTGQLREYIGFLHHVSGKLRHFVPITTHDTGSPAQIYGAAEATLSRYFVMALFTTGQTGMVQGVEYGISEKVEFIGRNGGFQVNTETDYAPFITQVNGLLQAYKVFANSGNLQFVDGGHETIIAAVRSGKFCNEHDVLLVANLDTEHEQSIELNLQHLNLSCPLRLHNMLEDDHLELTEPRLYLSLAPCGVKAFELRSVQP
jgi:hypothetical protein